MMHRLRFAAVLGLLAPVLAHAQPAPSGALVQIAVTCGASSTAVLSGPPPSATKFILIQNPPGAAATVWLNFAGAAATTAAPSIGLAAGQQITWSPAFGFVPGTAIACIAASGSQAISVLYQ